MQAAVGTGSFKGKSRLELVSWAVLAVWAIWWIASFIDFRLIEGHRTWVYAWPFLGLDFAHNYLAINYWFAGGDPMTGYFGDDRGSYSYAPVTLLFFPWCRLLGPISAVIVWSSVIAGIIAIGARLAARARQALGIEPLPVVACIAAALVATPTVFAMERGNYDALVLAMLMLALWSLKLKGTWGEILAGLCMALATWMKIYPAVAALAFLVTPRPRVVLWTFIAGVAIGAASFGDTMQWLENARGVMEKTPKGLSSHAHSLSSFWADLLKTLGLPLLARIPGLVAASILLLPLAAWTGLHVRRSGREALLYPYLLWTVALGTYVTPVSYDYNLFFLPLAALAVYSARDGMVVHWLMALFMVWWQPIALGVGPVALFWIKLAGLIAVGLSIVEKARRPATDEAHQPLLTGTRPAKPNVVQVPG